MSEPLDGPVRAEVRGTTLLVTLDNPKANAVNVGVSNALYAAFDRLESDPQLRVGVLTGAGGAASSWSKRAENDGRGRQGRLDP